MRKSRMAYIAGVYAFFQFLMPMVGWICVHMIVQIFGQFQKCIPWIALIVLHLYWRKHDMGIGKGEEN